VQSNFDDQLEQTRKGWLDNKYDTPDELYLRMTEAEVQNMVVKYREGEVKMKYMCGG